MILTSQAYEDALKQIIREKLEESLIQASDPNTKWLTHEEVFGKFREKYGFEKVEIGDDVSS